MVAAASQTRILEAAVSSVELSLPKSHSLQLPSATFLLGRVLLAIELLSDNDDVVRLQVLTSKLVDVVWQHSQNHREENGKPESGAVENDRIHAVEGVFDSEKVGI